MHVLPRIKAHTSFDSFLFPFLSDLLHAIGQVRVESAAELTDLSGNQVRDTIHKPV